MALVVPSPVENAEFLPGKIFPRVLYAKDLSGDLTSIQRCLRVSNLY